MGALSKLGVAVACAWLVQAGVVFADTTTPVTKHDIKTAAVQSCPKGLVKGPDGVCAHPKGGRMGFDLAGPSDSDTSSSSSTPVSGTRSVGTVPSHKGSHKGGNKGSSGNNNNNKSSTPN
jgi:hypothetical protein